MSVFNEALEWQDHAEQIDVGRNVRRSIQVPPRLTTRWT